MKESAAPERRFIFGWPEDRSTLFGLSMGQLGIASAVVVMIMAAFRMAATGPAIVLAIVAATAGGWLLFARIGGWPIDTWAATASSWGFRRAMGRHRRIATASVLGHSPTVGRIEPPPPLRGVELLAGPLPSGDQLGVICDRRAGIFSAVLRAQGVAFQLADVAEQQQRLSGWGAVLSAAARIGSPVHRLQWVEQTIPEDHDAIGRWLAANAAIAVTAAPFRSYTELVAAAEPVTQRHECLLAVSISTRRAHRAIRAAGGGDAGAVTVLRREMDLLADRLAAADIVVDGLLSPPRLAASLRVGCEPSTAPGLVHDPQSGYMPSADPQAIWPLACETRWATFRIGNTWHATYWVAHWPRSAVGGDFLAPLLLDTDTVLRTVSVTMEPIDPLRAHSDAEQALVKVDADDEERAKHGWRRTARRQRIRDGVSRREEELADGHRDFRITGLVTVSATTLEELEVACGQVEQSAGQCGLELRRLFGRQDAAWAASLPLGRGLA